MQVRSIDVHQIRASVISSLGKCSDELKRWVVANRAALAGLMILQVLAYSYFYTTVVFTDHTIPNSWLYDYPTFKTRLEGRWLADLIIAAQGGSGVQSFQMILATFFQSVNGIIFAQLVGLRDKRAIVAVAAGLCMYPAFLDYYCFSIDHVTFVLGDTLALGGAYAFIKQKGFWARIGVTALLFMLAIAAYQPKLAFVALLAIFVLAMRVVTPNAATKENETISEIVRDILEMAAAVTLAVGTYYLIVKLSVTGEGGLRTHINDVPVIIGEIVLSYGKFLTFFTSRSAGLPTILAWMPLIAISLGSWVILLRAWKASVRAFVIASILLLLIPISLRTAFIINNLTWERAGRIVAANGFCLWFFVGQCLLFPMSRKIGGICAAVLFYFHTVLASQESNAAAFKAIYELNFINRVAARVEALIDDPGAKPKALVVVGAYPDFDSSPYVRYRAEISLPHTRYPSFQVYRQYQILNFYFGQYVLRLPRRDELEVAIASMSGRKAWPAQESVYRLGETVIVMLEPYRQGIPVTWTSD